MAVSVVLLRRFAVIMNVDSDASLHSEDSGSDDVECVDATVEISFLYVELSRCTRVQNITVGGDLDVVKLFADGRFEPSEACIREEARLAALACDTLQRHPPDEVASERWTSACGCVESASAAKRLHPAGVRAAVGPSP